MDEIKTVKQIITNILGFTPESLTRREELGTELSFESALPIVKRLLGYYELTSGIDFSSLPRETISELRQVSEQTHQYFQQMRGFKPTGSSNPQSVREAIISHLHANYSKLLHVADIPHFGPAISLNYRRALNSG